MWVGVRVRGCFQYKAHKAAEVNVVWCRVGCGCRCECSVDGCGSGCGCSAVGVRGCLTDLVGVGVVCVGDQREGVMLVSEGVH